MAPKPSIVLILVDTLRADYLGTYGFEGATSPHIDALAGESVVFERCFSQAPWTKPAIASLFTSLQPAVHQVLTHQGSFGARTKKGEHTATADTLSAEAITLAEGLRAGGYATGGFVSNPWLRMKHGFGQGFDVYDAHTTGNAVSAEPLFDAALKWIASVPQGRPFFAYIHLMDVHGPYDAPEEDYEVVRDSPGLGKKTEKLTQVHIRRAPSYLRNAPWARGVNDARVWRGRYAANVHAADRRIGAFLEQLRGAGMLQTTLVVLSADHGEQLHEHGMWDHGNSLFDEELHVPLILRLPKGENGGRRIAGVVSLIDVMPTLIALANAPAVAGMQGRDLSPAIASNSVELEPLASFATAVKWKPAMQSARTERYKLIKNARKGQSELYDLKSDPGETSAITSGSPALVEVDALLAAHNSRNQEHGSLVSERAELPKRAREQLRALGYGEEPTAPKNP